MQLKLLQDILAIHEVYPEKAAIVINKQEILYSQLNQYSEGLAWQLQTQGLKAGDLVLINFGNSIKAVIAFWGILKAGGVACPIGADLAAKKITYLLQDSGAKLYLNENNQAQFDWQAQPAARITINRSATELACILYTSGSTGEPKGVMLSHENMLAALSSLNTYLQYNNNDKIVCVSPLSFDYGLYQMIMSISQGAQLHLFENLVFPTFLLKAIQQQQLTVLPGVPTLFSLLFEHAKKFKFNVDSIRIVTNTGAAMTLNHIQMASTLFSKAAIFSMYGLTECKRCSYLPPEDLLRKPGSVGIAIPNTKIWIADSEGTPLPAHQIGQLVVEGKTVMQGYWNKPEATKEKLPNGTGQLFTGDYGYYDAEGYLYFVSRMDDMLKSRGQKVSPKELEDMIIQMAGVKEAAVIGMPDTEHSDAIHLHIAVFQESSLDEAAVRSFCRDNLASHQQPKFIYLHRSLPKTENGKIDKQALKTPKSLTQLITTTIAKYPAREALFVEGKSYTYQDLHEKALICASVLQQFPGETCGLLCARSEALYIGLLASLYAGKAYIPFSARVPLLRSRAMLEVAQTSIVILDKASESAFKTLLMEYSVPLNIILYGYQEKPVWAMAALQHQFILLNQDADGNFSPVASSNETPAYLLFTSGTTGIPKGVMITHGNMLAYYQNAVEVYRPGIDDRFAQITELTFDLAMHDLFLAWGVGAALYILPESLYGSLSFYLGVARFVQQHQLTFWMSVPSTGTILMQQGILKKYPLPSLKCIIFCGEALSSNLAYAWQQAAPNSEIYNLYGPTEATIGFTYFKYHADLPRDCIVPIGLPFAAQQTAVLDRHFQPCSVGTPGELYLSGTQVVNGYWQNPEKSAERFFTLAVTGEQRLWYRTGDIVFINQSGQLQYVARIDDQLQIRGSRVEKLEIETTLRRIAGTEMLAVLPWPLAADGTVLGVVAFACGANKSPAEIIQQAKLEMPDYMIPKEIYSLADLPLNQNGKIDYKVLNTKLVQPGEAHAVLL